MLISIVTAFVFFFLVTTPNFKLLINSFKFLKLREKCKSGELLNITSEIIMMIDTIYY